MTYEDNPNDEENRKDQVDIVYTEKATRVKRSRFLFYGGFGLILVVGVLVAVVIVLSTRGGSPSGVRGDVNTQPTEGNVPAPAPNPIPAPNPQPVSALQTLLTSYSRFGGLEFQDEVSYQSKALRWVEENPPALPSATMTSTERSIQRYALACLYYATYKVSNIYAETAFGALGMIPWNNAEGWLEADDECTWFGVGCNEQGYVDFIDLERNALTGTVPYELSYLGKSLQFLRLDKNFFLNQGDEGLEFLSQLSELKNFSAHDSYFQYSGLPPQLAMMTSLEYADLSYVMFLGAISPDFLSGTTNPLPNLWYLDISGNSFHGPVPTSLARLPSLKAFYAMDSDITGSLDFITEMTSIQELWLDRNVNLMGSIPGDINKLEHLKSFSATACTLTGQIPSSLGGNKELQQAWLYSNQLQGPIPTEIGLLENLRILQLHNNKISGAVPSEVCSNRAPVGFLRVLYVDCDINCDCCDCCGVDCSRGKHRRLFAS